MITINSRLASPNLKIGKSLARLIQGFIYRHLPDAEHEGYRHEPSGKIFKFALGKREIIVSIFVLKFSKI